MNPLKKSLITCIILMLLFTITAPVFANSAEPPSILIIVENAPADLEITLKAGDRTTPAHKISKVIETYYTFYARELRKSPEYILQVSTKGQSFEIPMVRPVETYNTIRTLNLETRTLTEGKRPLRSVLLITLRVSLTLLLEAAVFWAMGFRKKRTWIAFLGINLLTQGALNLWLNGMLPMESYGILILVWGEFFVFLAELIAFKILVKEHSALRVMGTVLLANILSLVSGGYLITVLPL